MSKIEAVADEEMVKNAVGEDQFDELAEPPLALEEGNFPKDDPLFSDSCNAGFLK